MSHISKLKIGNINAELVKEGLKAMGIPVTDKLTARDYYGKETPVHDGVLAFELKPYRFVLTKNGDIVGDFYKFSEDFVKNTVTTALLVGATPGSLRYARPTQDGWEVEIEVMEEALQLQ